MAKYHSEVCGVCGHETRLYSHVINRPLVKALAQAYRFGRPFNLQKDLVLTKNQYNNFQKLQYFGLVNKVQGTTYWELTEKGRQFILGNVSLCNKAYTFGKNVIDELDEKVTNTGSKFHYLSINQVMKEDYKQLEDYLSEI